MASSIAVTAARRGLPRWRDLPVALNISTGFRTASPTLVNVGRVLGLPWWRMVTDVLFPAALPHAISGIKTGLGYDWQTIIAAGWCSASREARAFWAIPSTTRAPSCAPTTCSPASSKLDELLFRL